ncbi:hypothetical protein M408DRAFT_191120 [Serendipita vermifera MAFF 305830]|uniref:DUF6533 domain-containing protein n=1 Tax=Serendipita vermifera MAFF 305830 TaxID=933852 RepID=A0A0C2X4I5_SERVB|nr:hypothetical protein M408DRAFT_191120 [Serendipita vermifera MAFF 305830]
MAISADLIKPFIDALVPLQASRYLAVASLILVLYDWLLTLDDEVELIIPTPWTTVKVLYTIIRILTPVGLIIANYRECPPVCSAQRLILALDLSGYRPPLSPTVSPAWAWIVMIVQITIVASSSYLMLRRLCPLYGNSRRVTIMLNVAFFSTYIVVLVMSIIAATKIASTMVYSTAIGMCSTTNWGDSLIMGSAIFVGPMGFESVVFCLTGWKAFKAVVSRRTVYASPLHQIFFRDGLMHYASVLLVRILNIFIYFAMPPEYYYIGIFLLWATVANSTSRLFINLRAVSRGQDVWARREPPILSKFEMMSRHNRNSSSAGGGIQDIMIKVVTETA